MFGGFSSYFNFFFLQLAGAAILGVGIWVKVDSSSILGFLGKLPDAPSEFNQVLNVGYLLIAIGALLVLIGFLGCCGASKENKCMLLLVSCCLGLYNIFVNVKSFCFINFPSAYTLTL